MVRLCGPLRLLAGFALVGVVVLQTGTSHASELTAEQAPHPIDFDGELHIAMDTMMAEMAAIPMGATPEEDFLAMMIPHHQGAINMARALLVHGRDPLVRQLAEEIIAAQQVEIQSMQNRLEALRARPPLDPQADQALGGTRGDADTSALPTEPHDMHHP